MAKDAGSPSVSSTAAYTRGGQEVDGNAGSVARSSSIAGSEDATASDSYEEIRNISASATRRNMSGDERTDFEKTKLKKERQRSRTPVRGGDGPSRSTSMTKDAGSPSMGINAVAQDVHEANGRAAVHCTASDSHEDIKKISASASCRNGSGERTEFEKTKLRQQRQRSRTPTRGRDVRPEEDVGRKGADMQFGGQEPSGIAASRSFPTPTTASESSPTPANTPGLSPKPKLSAAEQEFERERVRQQKRQSRLANRT